MTKNLSLVRYLEQERRRVIKECRKCGLCNQKCPIIKHTELKDFSPRDIQEEVIDFLETGVANEAAYTRGFACMRCFQCVDNTCSQGLNPMLINEIIKWYYRENDLVEYNYPDPKSHNAPQRVIASIQVSSRDLERVLTPSTPSRNNFRYVLFPGCNVYFQPDKVLNVLDVMDYITKDYAFVPGLDYCCGNAYLSSGQIERGGEVSKELIDKLSSYNPDTVIFWCSTCLCNLHKTICNLDDIERIPFNTMSFARFLAQNMEKLPFKKPVNKKVTLHEPCKAAFTGLDLTGPRDVLKQIPGVELVEMPRHGKNTVCCGSAAQNYFPHSFEKMRNDRLEEAAETSADVLVDICHYCHEIFADQEKKYDYSIVNYMSIITEALGIEREDKFKKYKQWADIDKVLEDANEFVKSSPYSISQIREALEKRLSTTD